MKIKQINVLRTKSWCPYKRSEQCAIKGNFRRVSITHNENTPVGSKWYSAVFIPEEKSAQPTGLISGWILKRS